MNGSKFDRLTRTLARDVSRRGLLATAGLLAIGKGQAGLAAQLAPPTCAAAGEVCTLVRGCCDALTCVTSAINTNYGVCVPGEGGTVSIGTTLISPFSEEVEQEVAALANGATTADTSTTSTTTDLEAEREARIAAKKARKDDRRADKRLRQDTHKDELQDRREDRRFDREQRRGPKLRLELFIPADPVKPEIVRVTNNDDVSATLSSIESIPPSAVAPISPVHTLGSGDSFFFASGVPNGELGIKDNKFSWITTRICGDESEDGFRINAAFSASSENHGYVIMCDESGESENPRRKKRKRRSGRGGKGRNSRNKNG